jgi:hypothetical protein
LNIQHFRQIGIASVAKLATAAMIASVAFGTPVIVVVALSGQTVAGHSRSTCVTGQQVVQSTDCLSNLAAAQTRWPDAQLSLDSTTLNGSGRWLVLAADGRHFDEISVSGQLTPLVRPVARPANALSIAAPAPSRIGIIDALAVTVTSGSGKWSGACYSYYSYSYTVRYQAWYGTVLELVNSGTIDFCSWVSLSEYPAVYGAGSWTNSNGTYYNGAPHSYVYWSGTGILLCCSDSWQEYFTVGMFGNFSWSVTH